MSRIPSIEEFAKDVIVKEASSKAGGVLSLQKEHNMVPDIEVTVVTVCFNLLSAGRRELFLKNLDSVQAQEGVRLEHLIIDGGSSDGTFEWVMGYNNTKYNIRVLSKPDSGIYDAMNRGIALAQGKYIIFLNSDDYFHDSRGMVVSAERIEELKCDFSFAPIRFNDFSIRHNPQLNPQKRLYRFIISWCFSHQTMLASRSLLLRLDGFETSYKSAADYDLLLRMIVAGAKGCFVPLTFATFSTGGFSEDNYEIAVDECIFSLQKFYKNFYSVEMSYQEAKYIFTYRVYPSKYIDIYKHSQKLIRERFIGVPKGPVAWFSRWFNYLKYYQKCRKANI